MTSWRRFVYETDKHCPAAHYSPDAFRERECATYHDIYKA